MNQLSLDINEDDAYNFFCAYDKLSPLRKEIWKLTVWWVKRFPVAKPSQLTIAEKANCSRSAVSEAFKIFKESGWLYLISRGFKRSKILGIPIHLQQMDLVNRQYFKRVEATYRATHSYSSYKRHTGVTSTLKKESEIPFYLKKLGISNEQKHKLSVFPEFIFHEAFHICKRKANRGFIPERDEFQYFIGVAKKLSENHKVVPQWHKYYQSRKVS